MPIIEELYRLNDNNFIRQLFTSVVITSFTSMLWNQHKTNTYCLFFNSSMCHVRATIYFFIFVVFRELMRKLPLGMLPNSIQTIWKVDRMLTLININKILPIVNVLDWISDSLFVIYRYYVYNWIPYSATKVTIRNYVYIKTYVIL